MNLLPSQQFLLDSASATTTPGTPSVPFMSTALLCLVNSNTVTLNGSTPIASVLPITGGYAGYSNDTIGWNLPSVNSAGAVEVIGSPKTFRPTDSTAPQTIYGAYIMDSGSTTLLAAAPFDGNIGIPMQSALNSITLVLSYQPITASVVVTLIS